MVLSLEKISDKRKNERDKQIGAGERKVYDKQQILATGKLPKDAKYVSNRFNLQEN